MKHQDYDKEKWIKSLRVGNYVWDCRYKRRKIISFNHTGSGDKILNFRMVLVLQDIVHPNINLTEQK